MTYKIKTSVIIPICMSVSASPASAYNIPQDGILDSDSIQAVALSESEADFNKYARPEPLYKTPEAHAFQEYGKFSTEGATGSVDITIPIHTISCRDLQIPIALHYAGRGIKVAEEASWVGLGWDLSVGGCINCIAAGQYDFLVRNAQWKDYLEILNQESKSAFQLKADANQYTAMEDLIHGMGERDFYNVNLFGSSFLFFINPYDGKPTVIGADDKDYSITRSGADGWLIKDGLGYEYDFSALEYNTTDVVGIQKSAWYLSSVFTPQGITATFRYETTSVKGMPQAYQSYDVQMNLVELMYTTLGSNTEYNYFYGLPKYSSSAVYSNTDIQKPWLKSITTDNQTVSFELSERTDYKGARKLDRIKVTDINGSAVNIHHFNYSEFTHSTVGGSCPDILSYLVNEPSNGARLKLLSLSQMSIDQKDSLTYRFEYHEKYPLPMKTSAAIDFWGYYNGQENITSNSDISDSRSLIPSMQDCIIGYNPSIIPNRAAMSKSGACRFSDSQRMISGTLSSIIYPTGGKSVFSFEPHRFVSSPVYPLRNTGYRDTTETVEDLNYPSDKYNPGPVTNKKIDISGITTGYLTVTFEARSGKKLRDFKKQGAYVTIQPMASPVYNKIHITLDSCTNVNLDATLHKETFPVTLEPVSYMLIASLPESMAYGDGWVKATVVLRELDNAMESGGAGLRIAAIDNYDDDGKLTGRKEFDYTYGDGSASGKLSVAARPFECVERCLDRIISRNKYGDIEFNMSAKFNVIKINSSLNSGPAITGCIANGIVGYSRVTEKEFDENGIIIRSTINEYNVRTTDEPVPDMHLMNAFGGGEITRRTITGPDGNVIKTEEYKYDEKECSEIKCNITAEDLYYEYCLDPYFGRHVSPRYLLKVYPYPSYWRVLSEVKTKEYTKDGIIESKQTFAYNPSNRLQSQQDMTCGNTGTRTVHKYSVDYNELPYTTMCSETNQIRGIPVENISYELYDGIYTESNRMKCTYLFHPNREAMLQIGSIAESTAGASLVTRESFSYSDSNGALIGTVKDGVSKKAYLWSYANTCPVAVIEGATYQEVESWVGASVVCSLSNAKGGIDSLLAQVRTALKDKNVLVTTFTFKPLVGITSETDPTGKKTTYEYDGFNRLSRILDHNGKTIQTYSYSYN